MVKVIVGMMGSSAGGGSNSMASSAQLKNFLAVCKQYEVTELDTARAYNKGGSEALLGELDASKDFSIATKAPAFSPGSLNYDNIMDNCVKSLAALSIESVPLYYLHGPDSQTPYEDQCRAIATLYKEGKFTKWGVSNISSEDVEKIVTICDDTDCPRPSVYQGGYNPVNRSLEASLFPVLRKNEMSFYAYSPLAGGLLAKPIDEITTPAKGSRYDAMPIFGKIYLTDKVIKSLKELTAQCQTADVSIMEATLRWFMHHSPLKADDGIILGASTTQQIEATLAATQKGPLDQQLIDRFEGMWKTINEN